MQACNCCGVRSNTDDRPLAYGDQQHRPDCMLASYSLAGARQVAPRRSSPPAPVLLGVGRSEANNQNFESTSNRNAPLPVPPNASSLTCEHCGERLGRSSTLKRHRQSCAAQGQERHDRYSCGECDVTCARKDLLDRHVNSRHVKACSTCPLCKKKFSRSDYLKRHSKSCRGKTHRVSKLRALNIAGGVDVEVSPPPSNAPTLAPSIQPALSGARVISHDTASLTSSITLTSEQVVPVHSATLADPNKQADIETLLSKLWFAVEISEARTVESVIASLKLDHQLSAEEIEVRAEDMSRSVQDLQVYRNAPNQLNPKEHSSYGFFLAKRRWFDHRILGMAVDRRDVPTVKALLDAGFDTRRPGYKTGFAMDALDIAMSGNHSTITAEIVKHWIFETCADQEKISEAFDRMTEWGSDDLRHVKNCMLRARFGDHSSL